MWCNAQENTPNSILWVGQCATGFVEGVSAYELDSPCDSPDFLKEYGGTCPDCSCGGKSICKEMVDVWCDDDGFTCAPPPLGASCHVHLCCIPTVLMYSWTAIPWKSFPRC